MSDQVLGITIKAIGDFSDIVSNVNSVQKSMSKLKLPDNLGNSLSKNISNFMSEWDRYQKKIAEGPRTVGDNNAINKSLNSMLASYEKIIDDFGKMSKKDFKEIFNLDAGAFAPIQAKIKEIQAELNKIKLDPQKIADPIKQIQSLTNAKTLFGNGTGIDKLKEAFATNDLMKAKEAIIEIQTYYDRFSSRMSETKQSGLAEAIAKLKTEVFNVDAATGNLTLDMEKLNSIMASVGAQGKSALNGVKNQLDGTRESARGVTEQIKNIHNQEFGFKQQAQMLDRQIQQYFGLTQVIRKVGNIAKSAFRTVKDLDKAMTETAVVTNFSVGDMWEKLPVYTEQANKLGSTIKDVYEATTLYYQQGLNANQAMGLSEETLKMARIAGMDAAEATDMMTAALRGFNMEINQASAQKINDVYSQLAAITASNTQEIGSAMERTASIANSANMDFSTTSAFLAQMIETTREAPENLGTAMKTIVARFQEMKKNPNQLIDSEGVAMDVNKVDTALKSIGVALTNTKGEFRDLDDVFLDIASKWDSLSQGQQRYIATTAAGSRQQSRFIAMMSNYDRTMELVEAANNSAGASQKQFEKTMDSMSSKLNQLKNAWDQFTMGLMNNQILKAGVTGLTGFFTVVNKVIDVISKISPKPIEGLTKSFLTLGATLAGLNFAKRFAKGSMMAGVGWWENNGTTISENFREGYGAPPKRYTADKVYEAKINKINGAKQRREERRNATTEAKQQTQQQVNPNVQVVPNIEVDTSKVDPVVDGQVTEQVENNPVQAQKEVQVTPVPVENRMPFQRGADGTLHYTNSKGEPTQPVPAQQGTPSGPPIEQAGAQAQDAGEKTQAAGESAAKATTQFNGLGSSIARTGYLLQTFGDRMGPLGGVISAAGTAMMSFGTTIGALSAEFATARAAGSGFFASLGSSIVSVLGPMAILIASVAAIALVIHALDEAIVTDKERLEEASDAAAKASENYSAAKQELSELTDALDQIRTGEEAFDGLVAGTTEFNEKLAEANLRITELIAKYPELAEYVTTDKNGLMHLDEEGEKYIKERQQQIVGNTAALNALKTAQFKKEEDIQEAERIRRESIEENLKDWSKAGVGADHVSEYAKADDVDEARAKALEARAKANEDAAKQQAIMNALVGVEAQDRERLSKLYISSYDTALERAKEETKQLQKTKDGMNDMRKAYAAYNGYTYDSETKKFTDSAGDEVDISDEVVKNSYPEITVLTNFEVDSESFKSMEETLNRKFAKGLDIGLTSENKGSFLSDILANDAEKVDPKALSKLTRDKIEQAIGGMEVSEKASLLHMSTADFQKDIEGNTTALVDMIETSARNIHEVQAQAYEGLSTLVAQAKFETPDLVDTQAIREQLSELSAEQVTTLNTIGQSLQENVGTDIMETFIDQAVDIYSGSNEKLKNSLDDILEGVNWESPASRLETYTKMVNSADKEIQKMGKSALQSADEANILGETFDEFLGGDWTELSENADKFQNSMGEIDANGILEASKQSKTLKTLLDSGQVSATGVAKALQAVEEGKISVGEVNSAVLQLISSLDRLSEMDINAHNIIEGFDPGIDSGEGEDFVKENAKKFQEYYSHGEVGNEQVQNYIKLAAGEKKWSQALKDSKGNVYEATKSLKKYVTTFEDGFNNAWAQLIDDKNIDGTKLDEAIDNLKIDKTLKKKFKEVDFGTDKEDNLVANIGKLSTKELQQYFEEVYGVSKEYATLLIQDLKNYNATIGSKLQRNDLKETVRSDEFKQLGRGEGKNLILTDAEIKSFKEAGGSLKELAKAAGTSAEQLKKNKFEVLDDNGDRRNDYHDLLRDYARDFLKTGEHSIQSVFNEKSLLSKGKLDLEKLITDTGNKGFDEEQSMQAAWLAYQRGEHNDKGTVYNGVKLEGGLNSYDEFIEAINGIKEKSQWVEVGETIGNQIVEAFNAMDYMERMREGDESITRAVTEEKGYDSNTFDFAMSQIATGEKNPEQQQKDIITYLGQSKEAFDKLNGEEQAEALGDIVSRLNEFKLEPAEIASIVQKGLGYDIGNEKTQRYLFGEKGDVTFDSERLLRDYSTIPIQERTQTGIGHHPIENLPELSKYAALPEYLNDIYNLGINGKRAFDAFSAFGNTFGNTDINNRQELKWGADPTQNPNFKNAGSWGLEAKDLKGDVSTYLATHWGGFGKGENETQLVFSPMLQTESGPQLLSSESVDKYLTKIVEESTDKETGKIDTQKLFEADRDEKTGKNLLMGAFQGENAEEIASAYADLEHYMEEAEVHGVGLQELLNNIHFSPKLEGDELESYVKKIDGLTKGQKKILINTEITDEEKAVEYFKTIKDEFGKGGKRKVILEAAARFAKGDDDGAKELLKNNGFKKDEVKKIESKVKVMYDGKLGNPDTFKKTIVKQAEKVLGKEKIKAKPKVEIKPSDKKTQSIEVGANTGKATKKVNKIKKDASGTTTMTFDGDTSKVETARKKIVKKIETSNPVMKYSVSGPSSVSVPIKPDFGSPSDWVHTVTIKRKGGKTSAKGKNEDGSTGAVGINNKIPVTHLPSFGSAAKGRYGTVGPKNKGGLTLTGEKGYEVAWIPSESRSMILGVGGPQMLNLPNDAVVYTHEQSREILKRKSIPAGSHDKYPDKTRRKIHSTTTKEDSSSSKVKSQTKKIRNKDKDKDKDKDTNKESWKLIKKAGRVIVWWENQERKVDAIQRKIDKNQTAFEKALTKVGASLEDIAKDVGKYMASLRKSISINQEAKDKAGGTLKRLAGSKALNKEKNASDKAVKRANKKVKKASKTKDKSDDKEAKKELKRAKKRQKKAYKDAKTQVTWEEKYKKGKKTKTKKKKQNIDLSDFIKRDSTGALVIDQERLNKTAKRSKSKAKAIKEAATKKIETAQGRYNTADDNITKAKEALNEIGEKLYETFVGWETELTKIWNLTQKISNVEAKTNRLKEAISLQEAQMASGYAKASSSFNKKVLGTFSAQMKSMNESITTRGKLINEQKKKITELFTGTSIKNTITLVTDKLSADVKARKAKENFEKKKANLKEKNNNVAYWQKVINSKQQELTTATGQERTRILGDLFLFQKKLENAEKEQAEAQTAYNKAKTAYDKVKTGELSDAEQAERKAELEKLKEQETIRKLALNFISYSSNGDGTYNIDFNTDEFEKAKENLEFNETTGNAIEEYVKNIQTLSEDLNNSYTEQIQQLTELYTTLTDLQQEWVDGSNELLDVVENEQQKELEKIRGLSESLNEAIGDLLNEVKERLTERRNREDNLKTEQDISKKQQRLAALRADTSGGHAVEIAQLEKEVADAQQAYGRTLEDQLLDRLQRQADEAAKQRERMIELQEAVVEGTGEQSNVAKVNGWMDAIEAHSEGVITDDEMEDIWAEIQKQWLSNKNYDSATKAERGKLMTEWNEFRAGLETNYNKQQLTIKSIEDAQTELKNTQEALQNLQGAIENTPKTFTGDPLERVKAKAADAGKDGVINAAEFLDVAKVANSLGYSARTYMQALADVDDPTGVSELTWEEVIQAAKDANFSAYSMAKSFDSDNFIKGFEAVYGTGSYKKYRNNTSKGKAYAYVTGGLNTQTGPAWLDGTPTKPELVLNATDTKNFLALRDVLSDVMGSISSIDNSYRSNDVYNINVNVDKIANDYDVDKMVEKVKKEITKSAGYRNVTQARAFR